MQTYKIPLVPGPVSVPQKYREAYLTDYGSSDVEDEFFALLSDNISLLRRVLKTKNDVAIGSGEAMSALWGAMKSLVGPGDKFLTISNGLFGHGFGEMAEALGARVEYLEAPDGEFVTAEQTRRKISEFGPDFISAVHCETPSGLLNPLAEIAPAVAESGAIFIVDFVASALGADVRVDEWGIDIGLLGSQKCLSILPDIHATTVSERAWKRAARVNYAGYDALLPWKNVLKTKAMPYTHNWHANKAMNLSLKDSLEEGLENGFRRHEEAAALCRRRAKEMGLSLYAKDEKLSSPTVTAIMIPDGWTWEELDAEFRKEGLAVGGSWGKLAGKVFRIGHMGSQANAELVKRGMDVVEKVISKKL
ncbi:pyridoxal-phosphate-dependent aminotransferase family protein [Synergistes jonesii]|uniref:Aminotransferase n=1 Tax=Synergistes jonesii TaxID=2754 RepID=A0A073IRZ9_9BACT|nr:aminotransferase class V-fold PLP-dependent enzyme [Synergistes jonesii]KEJ92266.1 aminotransferase [Synergistes jonesii]OFB62718.1 aminotransferase [Synergistes jonesii]OFB63425.1 aminotransferase [Synergistes jonesii]OFB65532.1 aminotransferase [Synergistes jonesii]OFB67663.1 aminotransferase [Synergistes jonesii]